ncbi:MAG: DUF6428 family protein [Flavobacteriales bacterium]|jgi:hypothetical protein|tara:strand:- start:3065 stop:3592 length:528 start_codon:yes stop_codon:yes gene_type:complete
MKTKEFLTLLEENPNKNLRFEYHKGQFAREDFHLTEIKNVTYDTVDCGGMLNEWKETIVQIWENTTPDGNYVDTTKALEIAMKVDAVRPIVKDTEVKFEYGNSLFHTAVLSVGEVEVEEAVTIKLFTEATTCKAQDRATTPEEKAAACCPPQPKIKVQITEIAGGETCAPGSGCC